MARSRLPDGSLGLPSLAIVDVDTPGFTRDEIPMPYVGPDKQWTLFFDDVELEEERLIGGEGGGLGPVFDGLNPERIMGAAIACGAGRRALEKAAAYAGERVVWDAPIGTHQGIAHPLAEAKIELELARLMMQKAAALYDAGCARRGRGLEHGEVRGRGGGDPLRRPRDPDPRRQRLRARVRPHRHVVGSAPHPHGAGVARDDPQLRGRALPGAAEELLPRPAAPGGAWRCTVYRPMDLTLSPSEQAFRDELRAWLADNHPGEDPPGDDEAFEHRRTWQRKLYDAGYAGFAWPKEYGGRGATMVEQALFGEEMARAKAPPPVNVLGLVMGGPVVMNHGTDEQKERWLQPILTGDEIWCQGFSEPESGSDLASLKTRAVKSNGEWLVTGQKVWTTYAHRAKWCMLVARTDPDVPKHQGLTYFIMDMEQDAVQVRPLHQITGEPEFNELFMEEARIADENVVGGVGNGWAVAITTLMNERAGLGASSAAAVRIALEDLKELARERGVVDDPLIRQRIAQLAIEVELLRLNSWRGLTRIMKRGVPGPEGSLPKWQWGEINQALTELAVDILGEDGAAWDSPWTYRLLRSRANSIEGGTTEILKNIVAERVLGLPKLR